MVSIIFPLKFCFNDSNTDNTDKLMFLFITSKTWKRSNVQENYESKLFKKNICDLDIKVKLDPMKDNKLLGSLRFVYDSPRWRKRMEISIYYMSKVWPI